MRRRSVGGRVLPRCWSVERQMHRAVQHTQENDSLPLCGNGGVVLNGIEE